MRILVITSCTGEKAVKHDKMPKLEDFQKGNEYLENIHQQLADSFLPAESLYTGQQHVRLMRAVEYAREEHKKDDAKPEIDLHILSAGYGLVKGSKALPPYEVTFTGMKVAELKEWSNHLNIPNDFRQVVKKEYDFVLLLLGKEYLAACQLDTLVEFGGPTLAFVAKPQLGLMEKIPNVKPVLLTNEDAKVDQFGCPLISLKGELANRVITKLITEKAFHKKLMSASDVKSILLSLESTGGNLEKQKKPRPKSQASGEAASATRIKKSKAQPNPAVDKVITLSKKWQDESDKREIKYFVPEWDDLVDPDYDFENDIHSGGTGDWSNETFAHQMYKSPNYDGILISKVVAEKSKKKKERINRLGVHRFLRVPREYPIMGDCGAFGYIAEKNPPYQTDEMLEYYTRLDFDYGVSIDHLIVPAFDEDRQHRYDLTIHNAEEFLVEHKKQGLKWEPIGAVQGWDPKSYADAARQYVKMGYKFIALGSMVRTPTKQVLEVLREVHKYVPSDVKLHLFGLARYDALTEFKKYGVTSVDSASFLRRAWMGTGQNYLSADAKWYAAIRIPQADKSFRAKRMVTEGRATLEDVVRMEKACFDALKKYDEGKISAQITVEILHDYDQLITPDRPDNRDQILRTLEDAPWKKCQCDICKKDGIQVVIFRGNNRNRRRGFHNTSVFYDIFGRNLNGANIKVGQSNSQMSLIDEG